MEAKEKLDLIWADRLRLCFQKGNWSDDQLESLLNKDFLNLTVLKIIKGQSEVIENTIDCSATPVICKGSIICKHLKAGMFKFDTSSFYMYTPSERELITGFDLYDKLAGSKFLNANVFDYLIKHPKFIPEEWKGKYTAFFGTIFKDEEGRLYVKSLAWFGNWTETKYFFDNLVSSLMPIPIFFNHGQR